MKTDFATIREGVGAWIEVRGFSLGHMVSLVPINSRGK